MQGGDEGQEENRQKSHPGTQSPAITGNTILKELSPDFLPQAPSRTAWVQSHSRLSTDSTEILPVLFLTPAARASMPPGMEASLHPDIIL
jgi:hypothetical protein